MSYLEGIMELGWEIDILIVLGLMIWGAVICFLGYRIFRIVLAVVGFFVGAGIAGAIGLGLFPGETLPVIVIGLLGGTVGAGLVIITYFVGIFLLGAAAAVLIGTLASAQSAGSLEPVIVAILAVIGGVIAIILQKPMIIVCTSFGGSWSIVSGISRLVEGDVEASGFLGRFFENPEGLLLLLLERVTQSYTTLALCVVLGICGVVVQYKTTWGRQLHVV